MDEQRNTDDRTLIVRHLEQIEQREAELYKAVSEDSVGQSSLLGYLAALSTALEELRAAEGVLYQQNEHLNHVRETLETEYHRYQNLFEFAPDAYLITDIYGKIQEANQAASELFSLNSKCLVGKVLESFVRGDYQQAFRSLLLQLQTVDRIQEWEIKLITNNQISFDAALTISVVKDCQNCPIALRWLARNITARKQMEQQLQQMQLQNLELVEADRLKSQFIATISHELRTPMNAILGFSNLLLRQFHHRFEPQHLRMIERIFQNGQHLLTLIEDILDFSKLRSRQLELHLESFDLCELVTTLVEDLKPRKNQKNIQIQVHLPQELEIVNDRKRVRQILANLLSNAIKFTDQGWVTIEVEVWRDDRVAIAVRDTGIGIADQDLKSIFQEFRQINQTATRCQGGTGLGLAITKALTDLMEGEISVASQLRQGSTFLVELPRYLTDLPAQTRKARELN
ncbi:ATP-binding protein [Phormidesmis sp. 146-35]